MQRESRDSKKLPNFRQFHLTTNDDSNGCIEWQTCQIITARRPITNKSHRRNVGIFQPPIYGSANDRRIFSTNQVEITS